MSYILEALADSEQARRQIAVLPRYSLLPAVGEDRPQLRPWPYVLAAALLVNAAVLPLWLRSNSHDDAATIETPAAPRAAPIPTMAPVPDKTASAGGDVQIPKLAPAPEIAAAAGDRTSANLSSRGLPQARQPQPYAAYDRPSARAPRAADATPRKAANPAIAAVPAPLPKVLPTTVPQTIAKRAAVVPAATPAPIVPLAPSAPPAPPAAIASGATGGLPPALQREIPVLSVAGFIRDENSSGMVIVNDRLLREGDEVAPGLRLEKIQQDSLIFNYKGYSFRR
ncbi:MAG: general secretion pathway protein GspB [Burkholderiales bacterium]|nr:general secretion pathway protein GspB [Burkholderiales bacterium]